MLNEEQEKVMIVLFDKYNLTEYEINRDTVLENGNDIETCIEIIKAEFTKEEKEMLLKMKN